VLIRTFGFSDNSARLGQNSLGSAFGRTNPQIWLGHLSDNRTARLLFRTLGPSRSDLLYFGHSARSDSPDKAEPSYKPRILGQILNKILLFHKNTLKIKSFIEIDTVLGSTEINFYQKRLVMYDFRPRTLRNSAVRLSETVRTIAPEPSRNPSRALFGQSDKFGSARLSVGQTKKFWPRLSRRSDNPRIFVRMSTPGLGILSCPKTCNRSCFLCLQACPETCLNFGPKKKL
jgi:hypothetical protein